MSGLGSNLREIEEKVKEILAEYNIEELKTDASFVDDLGFDSLDIVELIMKFEDKFQIEISDEEGQKIRTVKEAIDYIAERIKK